MDARGGKQQNSSKGSMVDSGSQAAERLYNQSKHKKNVDNKENTVTVEKASLAPKTDKIVQNSVFFQGPCSDFLVRQQTFEDARVQRRELRRKIVESDNK